MLATKNVRLYPDTYRHIRKLAQKNHNSMAGMIHLLLTTTLWHQMGRPEGQPQRPDGTP